MSKKLEQMNIVVVGHVDHGKSTVVGRLLADTHSLPEGKLEQIQEDCRRTAKPFEYAFLLDALKDERSQGITIDSARCFFKSQKREYIIIDAPGHIEFLKNMISGAARAEAGVLVIDAQEGVQENSRRHGYLVSMLGIRQLAVVVNKMDLVNYDQQHFEKIKEEYLEFLAKIGIRPMAIIPASAREGENMVKPSSAMPWYKGLSVLEILDSFQKEPAPIDKPLRFPIQDVYRFTEHNDNRRIIAGRIETGQLAVGDEIIVLPSGKKTRVKTIEVFNAPPPEKAVSGQSIGITMEEQIYVRPGEMIVKQGEPHPEVTWSVHCNIFWLSERPMVKNKQYKMKITTNAVPVWLTDIINVLDASELSTDQNKQHIDRHDVAECRLQSLRPFVVDSSSDCQQTGRFVIVDNYEIVGGGVILNAEKNQHSFAEEHVRRRALAWERTRITAAMRAGRYHQRAALVMITGSDAGGIQEVAKALEEYLFNCGRQVYYLGVSNSLLGLDSDLAQLGERDEYLRRLGELSHLFTDAGLIFITTVVDLDDFELEMIRTLNQPNEMVLINIGENRFVRNKPDLQLTAADLRSLSRIHELLQSRKYLPEYSI